MANGTSTSDRQAPATGPILKKAEETGILTRREIVRLLSLDDTSGLHALVEAADRIRRRFVGDEVYLRGIVEFSNVCERNCLYCGLRKGNSGLPRYRMTVDEILEAASGIRKLDIGTLVLQSGEDSFFDGDALCRLVERIRMETGLVVTLSVGERPRGDYRAFREAGAGRFLLKHETASPALYRKLHPDSKRENRIQCLRWLRELGYEVGSGCMVGLPGQTPADLADDILLMKDLDADMLGIGPFIPHPQTPLAGSTAGGVQETLKMIAVARLVTRDTNIPATTALTTLDPEGRRKALACGANVVMPDFTPLRYRALYEIYPGRGGIGETDETAIARLKETLASLGRSVGKGPGDRRRS
jgi:biotin synthase